MHITEEPMNGVARARESGCCYFGLLQISRRGEKIIQEFVDITPTILGQAAYHFVYFFLPSPNESSDLFERRLPFLRRKSVKIDWAPANTLGLVCTCRIERRSDLFSSGEVHQRADDARHIETGGGHKRFLP